MRAINHKHMEALVDLLTARANNAIIILPIDEYKFVEYLRLYLSERFIGRYQYSFWIKHVNKESVHIVKEGSLYTGMSADVYWSGGYRDSNKVYTYAKGVASLKNHGIFQL